jgi:hypothetical protein
LPNAYLTTVLSWWRIDWITPREIKSAPQLYCAKADEWNKK